MPQPALADLDALLLDRLGIAPPDAVLRYAVAEREVAILPRDVAAIEISESGGITDIFVRLSPAATEEMAAITGVAIGRSMTVRVCGMVMLEAVLQAPIDSGTLYMHGTTTLRAEGMRALWHGRETCDTLGAEVFEHGQR